MEIKQVVIHELIKKSGTTTIDTKPADKPLDIGSPLVSELVAELNKLYGTKGNNAIYGTFSRKNITNEFPNYTDQYLKGELDDDFLALSIRCMAELTREASAQQSSTGGYIIFARYKEQHDFLLIAMIKDKQGLQVNDKLEPVSITSIDLSKIHQAARINLNFYTNISSGEEDPEDEGKAYLSFVSPRTNHDVSGYFIKALDCSDGVPSSRATKNAFTAVDAYCQTIPQLKTFRPKAKDSLIKYLEDCLKNKEPATLAGIEHAIRQIVPAEIHHLIDGFAQFANGEEHQLPDAFGVNTAKLKTYTRIISKNPNWELSFQRKALGTDENSELRYDVNAGLLTIRCSEDLKRKIEDELNNIHENRQAF